MAQSGIITSQKKSSLSAPTELANPEFREKFAVSQSLLSFEGVRHYIDEQVKREKEILKEEWKARRTEIVDDIAKSQLRGRIRSRSGVLRSAVLVRVAGFLASTGQAALVDLTGQVKASEEHGGFPVVYIDSMLCNTPDKCVQRHELDEVLQWEDLRVNVLHISDKKEMAKWIRAHIDSPDESLKGTPCEGLNARQIAKLFCDSAYPIRDMYRKLNGTVDFDYEYISTMLQLYGADEKSADINIAAGSPDGTFLANTLIKNGRDSFIGFGKQRGALFTGEWTLKTSDVPGKLKYELSFKTRDKWAGKVGLVIEERGIVLYTCSGLMTTKQNAGYGTTLILNAFVHAKQLANERGLSPEWALAYYTLGRSDVNILDLRRFLQNAGLRDGSSEVIADPMLSSLIEDYPGRSLKGRAGHFYSSLDGIEAKTIELSGPRGTRLSINTASGAGMNNELTIEELDDIRRLVSGYFSDPARSEFRPIYKGGFHMVFRYKDYAVITRHGDAAGKDTPLTETELEAEAYLLKTVNGDGHRKDLPYLLQTLQVRSGGQNRTCLIQRMLPEGKTLEDLHEKDPKWLAGLTTHQRIKIILSIAKTMQYLASFGVIHRDLDPKNIWIPDTLRANPDEVDLYPPVVFDFSNSIILNKARNNGAGPYRDQIYFRMQREIFFSTWYSYLRQNSASSDPVSTDIRKDLFGFGTVMQKAYRRFIEDILSRHYSGKLPTGNAQAELEDSIDSGRGIPPGIKAMMKELLRLNPLEIPGSLDWDEVVRRLEDIAASEQPDLSPGDMSPDMNKFMTPGEAESFIQRSNIKKFIDSDDIKLGRKLIDKISKLENVKRVAVVGNSVESFPYYLALIGKEVIYIDTNERYGKHMEYFWKRYVDEAEKEGSHYSYDSIKSINAEIGTLDIEQNGIMPGKCDLVTFIDLAFAPVGEPKMWFDMAKKLLRPDGYIITDVTDEWASDSGQSAVMRLAELTDSPLNIQTRPITEIFKSVFPDAAPVSRDPIIGSYGQADGLSKNALFCIKPPVSEKRVGDSPVPVEGPQPAPTTPLTTQNLPDIEVLQRILAELTPRMEKQQDGGKYYTVKYNIRKIPQNSSAERLLKLYVEEVLPIYMPGKDRIKLIPSAPRGLGLITVECYNDQARSVKNGEGRVDIEEDVTGKAMRLLGIFNMAFLASQIPSDTPADKISQYDTLISLIKSQYKAIAGEDMDPNILKDISRGISIVLPRAAPVALDKTDEYYRLTIKQLEQAA